MIETREIHETDDMTGFNWFKEQPFDPEFVHILLVLKEDDEDKVWCYVWNLDSIKEADTTDYIEIDLIEAREAGKGWGTKMIEELKQRYSHISVCGSENDEFWNKVGFEWIDSRSEIDGSRLMEWKR